ncbi:MAG TPA: protein-disulfide reductase DsbD N-terminal domain-containing protein [Pyrinomonadaceae bacterium]|nr:protein-disulfide reductase DsbD N-terminal domain-containing protein [Pyrinomonadaceae bacterium]
MTQKITLLILCLSAIFVSACSQTETANKGGGTPETTAAANNSTPAETTTKAPPADVVRVETPSVEIKAGGSTDVALKLTIAKGYHINANPPSFSYLKATELTIEQAGGITPGKPVYPSSVTRKFAFSKDPLAVYEGETAIKLPLTAAGSAPKGVQTLKGKLRIQACDEEACYPPRTLETSIPVTVK